MIHIKRPDAPDFLSDPDKKWVKETENAKKHYEDPENSEAFSFDAYNDQALKDELKKVFTKCAYCESSYGAVSDGDVEHFRPKGKVSEKNPQVPGYYWLANDWNNLLLSCQHCNQRRKHILHGETTLAGYGKLDQFPLSDESKRVGSHEGEVANEEPARLLLNPCLDRPEDHFDYEVTEGVMIPLSDRGTTSISVYALRRPLLVLERKKQLILLLQQMERVKRELERFNSTNSAADKQVFEKEFDLLIGFTKTDGIYAGMCRFFVRQFLKENNLA